MCGAVVDFDAERFARPDDVEPSASRSIME
jgi:hypothetical protein